MLGKRAYWILGGLTLLAGGAAIASALTQEAVTEEAKFRIRDFFEVGPDCDWISLKMDEGETADEEAFRLKLAEANTYYFEPMIAAGRRAGIDNARDMTIWILEDIFPECAGQFPPEELLDVSKQLLWFAMQSHVQTLMEKG